MRQRRRRDSTGRSAFGEFLADPAIEDTRLHCHEYLIFGSITEKGISASRHQAAALVSLKDSYDANEESIQPCASHL
ncbi:unnamed protein product [Urochloa humidicola]